MRLISDREAKWAIDDVICDCLKKSRTITSDAIQKALDSCPTVEAEPIKHERWKDQYGDGDWHCTGCGAIVEKDEQYRHNWYRCYHCGAKMDGKESNNE